MTASRALLYAVKIAILVAVAIWLAERPGSVAIDWLGYRIETHIGILLLAVLIFAVLVALLYRAWRAIYRTPKELGRALEENKRRKGFKALTQGMVAVAAGDPQEAARQARRSQGLLNDPPLTMLLSAQAAQLGGDEAAARRYFESMLENPETRFLGLRGLINQSMKRGEDEAALAYLKEAYKLRPSTPWVLESMSEVCERLGDWSGAEQALREAGRHKALPKPDADERRAMALIERARGAAGEGRNEPALKDLKEALKLKPAAAEALALQVEVLTAKGEARKAQKEAEKSWALAPGEALARAYRASLGEMKPLDRYKRVQRLVSGAAAHLESRLALAEAALEARLWGEARKQLSAALEESGDTPERRLCLLMAELEESEHGNVQAARDWLLRAQGGAVLPAVMEERLPAPTAAQSTALEPLEPREPGEEAEREDETEGTAEAEARRDESDAGKKGGKTSS